MLEYLEWTHQYAEHVPFFQKMAESGRKTPLETKPELDEESQELWQMYCFTSGEGNLLMNVDIYVNRIGLPIDWEFEECLMLVADMTKKRFELEQAKRGRQHTEH